VGGAIASTLKLSDFFVILRQNTLQQKTWPDGQITPLILLDSSILKR